MSHIQTSYSARKFWNLVNFDEVIVKWRQLIR